MPTFGVLPEFLSRLILGRDARSTAFKKSLRRHNNAFAFTSVNFEQTDRGVRRGGPLDFQIRGALYHKTVPLEVVDRPR